MFGITANFQHGPQIGQRIYRVLRKFVPIFAPIPKTQTRSQIQLKLHAQTPYVPWLSLVIFKDAHVKSGSMTPSDLKTNSSAFWRWRRHRVCVVLRLVFERVRFRLFKRFSIKSSFCEIPDYFSFPKTFSSLSRKYCNVFVTVCRSVPFCLKKRSIGIWDELPTAFLRSVLYLTGTYF